jgi:hypothetical protein
MMTIFSIPKPFAGHIGIIQSNAIQSWRRLVGVEVILLGNDVGVGEAARRFGATWLPQISVNPYGTPLLSSAFEQARAAARHPLLCYLNADIVVLKDFAAAVRQVRLRNFLMLGQRWDLDVTAPIDFSQDGSERLIREWIAARGVLHPPTGSDYFVFPKDGGLAALPPFAVGRPVWDNWLIYRARQLEIPVVDASQAVTIVHQNHDYAHVKEQRGAAWEGPEAEHNRALAGGAERVFTLKDATHRLAGGKVIPTMSRGKVLDTFDAVRRALRTWARR